jgi:hypothetical protein
MNTPASHATASPKTQRYPAPELKDVPEDIRAKIWKSRKRLGLYRKCSWLLPVALQSGAHFLPTTTPSWCQSPWAGPAT